MLYCITFIVVIVGIIMGCVGGKRGLFSAKKAEENYFLYKPELETAASWMKENQNIWFVVKGKDSEWDPSRIYTKIDDYAIFSKEPLTELEMEGIKQAVLPAFCDPILESVRKLPEGFATYICFVYHAAFYDESFSIYKEIERTDKGELTDSRYYTFQKDPGDGWYIIRSSS
jgi:hypothetical protein